MSTLYTEEEAAQLAQWCPQEDRDYPPPPSLSYPDGRAKYAYITLVMIGDAYVPAAVTLAHSLIKCGSQADRLVMVTPDVSVEGKQALDLVFTKVIEVPYIRTKHWRGKFPGKDYLNLVFTKFHLFKYTEYEKLLLIDADALVLDHPDHLFALETPAGCYIEQKNLLISYDRDGNYVLPSSGEIEWYRDYCDCCGHGRTIPKEITDRVLKKKKNSGVGGGLMLLKPDPAEFDRIVKDINGRSFGLVNRFFVWPEQQYLTQRYSGRWIGINPRFFGLQGYPHYRLLFGLQYGGDKPFRVASKFPVSVRRKYPDFTLWHQYFREILKQYPELLENPSLSEAVQISRQMLDEPLMTTRVDRMVERIEADFRLPQHRISSADFNYYRRVMSLQSREMPLVPDVEQYDFATPIADYRDGFTGVSNYYQKLLAAIRSAKKQSIDLHRWEPRVESEVAIAYTLRRSTVRLMIIYGEIGDDPAFETPILKRSMVGSRSALEALWFAELDHLPTDDRFAEIDRRITELKIAEMHQPFTVYLFEGEPPKLTEPHTVTESHQATVWSAQLLLHRLSWELIASQQYRRLTTPVLKTFVHRLDFYYFWLADQIPANRLPGIVIGGDSVWAPLGLLSTAVVESDSVANKYRDRPPKFVDLKVETGIRWQKSRKLFRQLLDDRSLGDFLLDPDHYFYFRGMKILAPKVAIDEKLLRLDSHDYADLIVWCLNHKRIIGRQLELDGENRLRLPERSPKRLDSQTGDWAGDVWTKITERHFTDDYRKISRTVVDEMKPVGVFEMSRESDVDLR